MGKRIPKFSAEREIEHLREACVSSMEKALFEFMFSTGCRIGEIVSLDKNCINWSNCSEIVRGKGDNEREVYYNVRCDICLNSTWIVDLIKIRPFCNGKSSTSNEYCTDEVCH